MRNEFEENAKKGYGIYAEDEFTENPDNKIFLDKMNERILKHMNLYDLCSTCQMGKECPYRERIFAACDIISENTVDLNKKVKEKLGENPYVGKYRRWHWEHGPIMYCESYNGLLTQELLNEIKLNNTIYLVGDYNDYSEIIGIQKELQGDGNIVYVDFIEAEKWENEDFRKTDVGQNLLASYLQKIMLSDEVFIVERKDAPNITIMNYLKMYADKVWHLNVSYVYIK